MVLNDNIQHYYDKGYTTKVYRYLITIITGNNNITLCILRIIKKKKTTNSLNLLFF